jgi:uncharacterized sporulation protein YeaH/YhbH (DUF444 family)
VSDPFSASFKRTPSHWIKIVANLQRAQESAARWKALADAKDAEITRLRAEVETLADSNASKADRLDRLGETVARIRKMTDGIDVEALRADAERYRWLRETRYQRAADGTMRDVFDEDGTLLYMDELDAAIDAARAAVKATT